MRMTANVKRRFDMEHRILDKLSKIMPVNEEQVGFSYPMVADRIKEPVHAVLAAKRTMEDAGILRTRIDYPKGQSGRVGVWTLVMPVEMAHIEMTQEHERQLARPSGKTQRRRVARQQELGQSILRYVTGEESTLAPFEPLRALRKDEALALLEAARQYRSRADVVEEKMQELGDAGVEVNPEAFAIRKDERLEHVALILPAFDSVVAERDRFAERANQWSSQIVEIQHERDALAKEVRDLRRLMDKRVAREVATTQGHT